MLLSKTAHIRHKLFTPGSLWQGTIAGALSLFLGICALAIMSLPTQTAPLLLAALLFLFVATIVGDLRQLFLIALVMDIPLRLDINFMYREEMANLGSIEGLNVSVTILALVGLYALWLGQFILDEPTRPRPRFGEARVLGVYVVVVLLSMLVARDPTLSLFQLNFFVQEFLMFVYIVSTTRTKDDVLFLMTLIVIGLIYEGGLIVISRFTGLSFSIAGLSNLVDAGYITDETARLGGTLGSPNYAAAYLAIVIPIAMSFLLIRTALWRRVLAIVGVALGGMALVFTLSRGGWTAFAIAALIFCLFAWRRGKLSPSVPCAIVVLGILLFVFFHDEITSRFFTDDQGAAYSRVPLMHLAFRMIEDNPLLGVGANNFAFCIPQYLNAELNGMWLYTVHNKYLLLWAEIGTIGLSVFLWFFLSALRRGWQSWRLQNQLLAPFSLGVTSALIGHAFHMLAEAFNGRPVTNLLVLCTALLAAMLNISRQERATASHETPQPAWSFRHA